MINCLSFFSTIYGATNVLALTLSVISKTCSGGVSTFRRFLFGSRGTCNTHSYAQAQSTTKGTGASDAYKKSFCLFCFYFGTTGQKSRGMSILLELLVPLVCPYGQNAGVLRIYREQALSNTGVVMEKRAGE